jgi:hypothetical protein
MLLCILANLAMLYLTQIHGSNYLIGLLIACPIYFYYAHKLEWMDTDKFERVRRVQLLFTVIAIGYLIYLFATGRRFADRVIYPVGLITAVTYARWRQ